MRAGPCAGAVGNGRGAEVGEAGESRRVALLMLGSSTGSDVVGPSKMLTVSYPSSISRVIKRMLIVCPAGATSSHEQFRLLV